jgi:hypothetical protein
LNEREVAMRKLVLGMLGATALGFASAANATLVITTPTSVTVSGPNVVNSIEMSIDFVDNGTDSPFSETLSWMNDMSGVYAFRLITNATVSGGPDDVDITAAFVTGTGIGSPINLIADPGNTDLRELFTLAGLSLAAGDYTLTVEGTRGDASQFGGHVVEDAVPEPATWAMMLLGFGGLGWQLRRRRRSSLALAQAV